MRLAACTFAGVPFSSRLVSSRCTTDMSLQPSSATTTILAASSTDMSTLTLNLVYSPSSSSELATITLDEVAWHDTHEDCWLVVCDYVYDCTEFLKNHPGGHDVMLEYAGRDATLAFIGTGHSQSANRLLKKFLIGELPPHERIFRIPNGIKIGNSECSD